MIKIPKMSKMLKDTFNLVQKGVSIVEIAKKQSVTVYAIEFRKVRILNLFRLENPDKKFVSIKNILEQIKKGETN